MSALMQPTRVRSETVSVSARSSLPSLRRPLIGRWCGCLGTPKVGAIGGFPATLEHGMM